MICIYDMMPDMQEFPREVGITEKHPFHAKNIDIMQYYILTFLVKTSFIDFKFYQDRGCKCSLPPSPLK